MQALAERLGALLGCPCASRRTHVLTVSIGVSFTTDPDRNPEDLVRDADAAMYRAKERGKDRCELFGAEMRTDVTQRLEVSPGCAARWSAASSACTTSRRSISSPAVYAP